MAQSSVYQIESTVLVILIIYATVLFLFLKPFHKKVTKQQSDF